MKNGRIVSFILLPALLAVVFLIPISGQEKKLNSRNNYSKDLSTDVLSLIDSANNSLDFQPQEAFSYIEKALDLSVKTQNLKGEALCNHLLGKVNYRLEQYDLAVNYLQRALQYNYILNKDEVGQVYKNLAQAYEKNNNLDLSLEYYKMYLAICKELNYTDEIVQTKYDLARIHTNAKQYNTAIKEYSEIQEIESERNNPRGIITANESKGEVYLKQNLSQEAISNLKNSVEVAEEISDKKVKSRSLRKLGDAYRQSNQTNEELNARKEALKISEEEEGPEQQASDNLAIAEVYIQQNKPDEAVEYIQKSVQLAESSGNIKKKGNALKVLSEAYKDKGEYEDALLAYKEYTAVTDSLHTIRENELRSNMEIIASVNRKLQRIDMLEKDFEINRKNLELLEREQLVHNRELKNQKRITSILIMVLVILSTASFLVYRSSIQKRKANQLLALKSLRSQMNPHFIFNSLNSVNNYIAQNNERMANKYLSEFSKLMRSVMENSKHDFVSIDSEIEIIDLYLKLEHSRFKDKFDFEFEVDRVNIGGELKIPPMLIQPYIENAIWHGLRYKEAKGWLKVSLKRQKDYILATIKDNGIGRKKSEEIKTRHQKENISTGIKNITNRLDIINQIYRTKYTVDIYDLDLENQFGTVVEIKIPFKKE